MIIFTLVGRTKAAKAVVKHHGERWECVKRSNRVPFSSKAGPWMLLEPLGELRVATNAREARHETAARWVHALTDEDFKVMP